MPSSQRRAPATLSRSPGSRKSRPTPAPESAAQGCPVTPASRTGFWLGALALFVVLSAGSVLVARHHDGIDDAYISYRYAHNLASGAGLVFNPGERVEGFTNLLYVLLIAPACRLGLHGVWVYRFSVGLNLAASLLLLGVLLRTWRRRFGPGPALLGGVVLACAPVLWYWTASGLETTWVLLLQVLLWLAVERLVEGERRALAIAVGAAVLSVLLRADGFVFPLLAVLYLFLRGERRAALALAGATVLTVLALVTWQWRYYGQPLPNPYYVKVAGSAGARLEAAVRMLIKHRQAWCYWLAFGLAAGPAVVAWLRTRDLTRVPAGVFLGAGLLAYYLFLGGDFFGERFLLFLAVVGITGLLARGAALRPATGWAWAIGLLLLYQAAVPTSGTARLQQVLLGQGRHMQGTYWAELGRYLHDHEAGKSIAVDAAGRIPFFSGLYTIDMLGLCDNHIAHLPVSGTFRPGHDKFDPEYLLSREPDLIAAWATNDQDDLAYGLSRSAWERDYALKYLLYADSAEPPGGLPYVVEAGRLSVLQRALLFRDGYRYAVLARKAGR